MFQSKANCHWPESPKNDFVVNFKFVNHGLVGCYLAVSDYAELEHNNGSEQNAQCQNNAGWTVQ